jgi:beta-galactosidase
MAGRAWLDEIGVRYEPSGELKADAGLLLIGPDAKIDEATLRAYLEAGGKAFFLPRSQADGPLGVAFKPAAADFAGSLSVPEWPEARGLSASDLRWRTHLDTVVRKAFQPDSTARAAPPNASGQPGKTDVRAWLVSGGADIGADGLIGRKLIGKGVALFCQIDPDRFQADERTYFRYTRWRSTRAVAQLLANLGASFPVDSQIFHPLDHLLPMSPRPEGARSLGYYHPDYRTDFPMGDNPYRYYRW